jgi:ribosomal protein S18 acetylase RimI-like enzyme
MESIVLTQATPRDIDQIMDMEAQGFATGNRELREVYEARIKAFPQGSLMAHFGANCIGCIFSEIWKASPVPIAEHFALSHDILDRHDPLLGTELYITSMTIAPAFRGKGLGTQLFLGCIGHVAAAFPQLTSALLLVNETWRHARSIYEAAGFQEVARFKHFFNPNETTYEDGIVMRRQIQKV